MINISTNLKNALKKDTAIERDYIIMSGTTDRIYLWFKLYDDCYKDGNIVQNFIMKRLEFDYADNDIEFKQKEFKAYKEYKLENGEWEAICYGTFIVADISENDTKESVKVTAYDYALKFANTYVTDLDYASGNITLLHVFQECRAKCGVETSITSFTNSNFIVDGNQFENTAQFGNVMSAIAGASGNFAKIENDKLVLKFTNSTGVIIDASDYEEFEDKRDTHPITVVGLGVSNIEGENVVEKWEEGIAQYGENYIMINDNPFAYTQGKRQQLLPALFNKLKGFRYSAMSLKNCLFPHLQCGDLIKVKNKDGNLVDTIVLKISLEDTIYNLEAPSITKATVNYQNVASALEVAKRAEIIVNKQEGTISILAAEQNETTQKVVELQQDISGFDFKLQSAGGVNLLQNSTLEQSFNNNNTFSGDIAIVKNIDVKNATTSKSAIKISSGFIKTSEVYINEYTAYTFSCLILKNELTNVSVKIITDKEQVYNIVCEANKFQLFTFPIYSSKNNVNIEVSSDNNYCLIADRMLNKGSSALGWQPYTGEVTTRNVKINDDGLKIESDKTNSTLIADSEELKIANKLTKQTQVTFNGDETIMTNAKVTKRFVIGKLRTTVLDNNDIMFSWDD